MRVNSYNRTFWKEAVVYQIYPEPSPLRFSRGGSLLMSWLTDVRKGSQIHAILVTTVNVGLPAAAHLQIS
ncbi:hypothetical protein PaeBR_18985 [Paenibacillus sp. BR2-3]|uniref:hypothetical protein n=1 Tax=Paenibacillus sp. BR2-3 TaxID=3048494 RepID=UPI00397761E6